MASELLPPSSKTLTGISVASGATPTTPNPFRVSAFPNANETEPNDAPKQAKQAVAWPVAFNGIVEKPGDADHFRFRAKRGDVIDVNAFAFRIGSPLDTVVAVLDANGELVAGNDDDETHDSRLQVTIPDDGEYFVRVTDKKLTGAHYVQISFSGPADSPANLREKLRLNGSVYRTFIQSA